MSQRRLPCPFPLYLLSSITSQTSVSKHAGESRKSSPNSVTIHDGALADLHRRRAETLVSSSPRITSHRQNLSTRKSSSAPNSKLATTPSICCSLPWAGLSENRKRFRDSFS